MATPAPAEELAREISSIKSELNRLQDNVRLSDIRDAVEDLQTNVHGMSQEIANLRARGYVFEKELEDQAVDFSKQWSTLQPTINQQLNTQSSTLQATLRPLESQMAELARRANSPIMAKPLLGSLKSSIDTLKEKVSAAERSIQGMYDQFERQVNDTLRHLKHIDWMLDQLGEAPFQLLPTEGGIMAVKAVWCKTGKEKKSDPEGVLYLTDQRLIFEQKEDVATKKVLFIATEKKKIQETQLEVPVTLAKKVTTSKQGLLKNEDHIEIHFESGAPVEMAHFHIWQDCATWQSLINRAKSKDFDKGRAVAIDQAEVEKVKAAPSQCPSCGANIKQVVLRGMDSINCEYCGFVIRL